MVEQQAWVPQFLLKNRLKELPQKNQTWDNQLKWYYLQIIIKL